MRVSVSSIVAKPAETLFWLSQDYSRRLEWDKYLAEAYLVGHPSSAAVGVESFCKNRSGSVLVSKYISFSPPTHAAVQMTSGPWVLSKFGGTWRFDQLDERSTQVRFIYNFKARPAALKWLLEPLIGTLYRRDMQRRLAAFKRWAEQACD
jgi:ribosome-associated toxin RatA of RatAB toxin-antitoxin module